MVIAFYNEADFLGPTLASLASLASLAGQTVGPLRLILVDNGSTDGSAGVAQRFARGHPDLDVCVLSEPTRGQVHALAAGLRQVRSPLAAIDDADTIYPPDYLAKADAILPPSPSPWRYLRMIRPAPRIRPGSVCRGGCVTGC